MAWGMAWGYSGVALQALDFIGLAAASYSASDVEAMLILSHQHSRHIIADPACRFNELRRARRRSYAGAHSPATATLKLWGAPEGTSARCILGAFTNLKNCYAQA